MAKDPEQFAHLEWLGYVQPVGLVVSIPALLAAQAFVNRNIAPDHHRFLSCLPRDRNDEVIAEIPDLAQFTRTVLGWELTDLTPIPSATALPEEFAPLEVVLPEYHETLRPTYVVREFEQKNGRQPWLMLIQELPSGSDLDQATTGSDRNWNASPHAKFERLLRETEVPIGLLVTRTQLRLIYAPRGETSGYMTFSMTEMAQIAGRPIFAGLHMLLSAERLFILPEKQRLPAILSESRKYQNIVSTQLAHQVLAALYELLRGFQGADDQRHGELLRDVLDDDPNQVYAGLLTVLLRLVFTLYAEDRGLLSGDPLYANSYSVTGLFDRLRADAGRYPDTMNLRYGAWPQLLTLFRLIYEGGRHDQMHIPARKGYLFDPDRYPFLEGRPRGSQTDDGREFEIPHISDGVIFRVLNNLLILDGERLSYRTLDVEQIGSVYEAIMGFNLEVAQGRSIAIKPTKPHGAPSTINLEDLLAVKATERVKWLADKSDQKLTGQTADGLKNAESIDDLLVALDGKIDKNVTPNIVPAGSMVFQPSDERRKSGSHYTPRSLTEPIVRTTLKPILERLGDRPKPEEILDLKVCDPAMGSGAFLVEACRQLADVLVKTWHLHDCVPAIPLDEDEILHARRLVAQRCLFGVDKNPMAVDLAKLSLWLATLAKEHPFTFLDHSLRHGDSLVGLTRHQIEAFHWNPPARRSAGDVWFGDPIAEKMKAVTEYRQRIVAANEDIPYEQLSRQLDLAEEALSLGRLTGDLVIAAYFSSDKDRQRIERLNELARTLVHYFGLESKILDREQLTEAITELRTCEKSIEPLHWEIEFPEVFGRKNSGFDVIVGNPPFLGGKRISGSLSKTYGQWLQQLNRETSGNADLVAHFFRRSFSLIRQDSSLGLIATNTVAQGDTRRGGLRWIGLHGGEIYYALRRMRWPGMAAVVVSVLAIFKGSFPGQRLLNGKKVDFVSAFLFHRGTHEDPARLASNSGGSFIGCDIKGQGFLFDDTDETATPVSVMQSLISKDVRNAQRILPYIGGEEINTSPTLHHHRWVIYFGEMEEREARQWPTLLQIVEAKVRPERLTKATELAEWPWWRFWRVRRELYDACEGIKEVLVVAQTGKVLAFAFKKLPMIFSHTVVIFPSSSRSLYCVLQSRVHQEWTLAFSATMKDDARYIPQDCYDTYPFPHLSNRLEDLGKEYYEFRAQLMVKNNEGLTKTYNRFHDPNESSSEIKELRKLHAELDRAVLDAYGWKDLKPTCDFLLDYEEEEEDDEDSFSRRKKPWRYRWPDDFRDEVLARLLELNKQRAEEERLAGLVTEAGGKKTTGSGSSNIRTTKKTKSKKLPGM